MIVKFSLNYAFVQLKVILDSNPQGTFEDLIGCFLLRIVVKARLNRAFNYHNLLVCRNVSIYGHYYFQENSNACYFNSCQAIYMRKLRLITACQTEWYVSCHHFSFLSFLLVVPYRCSHCRGPVQGNDMDSSRGVLSGTMDRFKMVSGGYQLNSSISIPLLLSCNSGLQIFRSFGSFPIMNIFLFLFKSSGFRDQIQPENVYASGIIRGHFSSHILSHQVNNPMMELIQLLC